MSSTRTLILLPVGLALTSVACTTGNDARSSGPGGTAGAAGLTATGGSSTGGASAPGGAGGAGATGQVGPGGAAGREGGGAGGVGATGQVGPGGAAGREGGGAGDPGAAGSAGGSVPTGGTATTAGAAGASPTGGAGGVGGEVWEVEDNDAWDRPTVLGRTSIVAHGGISPLGDTDWYRFDVPGLSDLVIELLDPGTGDTCDSIYLEGTLYAAGTPPVALGASNTAWGCAVLDFRTDDEVASMAPGTYYLRVRHPTDSATPDYRVRITFVNTCGNGEVTGSEECDTLDRDVCDVSCHRVPRCGDGHVDAPEGCDEAAASCSDTCLPTYQDEGAYEPNDSLASADTNAASPPGGLAPLLLTGDAMVGGSLLQATPDLDDYIKIRLAADTYVNLHMTTDERAVGCSLPTGSTTSLRLYDSPTATTDAFFASDTGDDDTSSSRCANLPVFLRGNTDYYLRVFETAQTASLDLYRVELDVLDTVVTETEPNDLPDVEDLSALADFVVQARIEDVDDFDYFLVTVPPGQALWAQTFGAGTDTCATLDSVMAVYDDPTSIVPLASNDDRATPANSCSILPGVPNDTGAPAAWFIVVSAWAGGAGSFDYSLAVFTKPI